MGKAVGVFVSLRGTTRVGFILTYAASHLFLLLMQSTQIIRELTLP